MVGSLASQFQPADRLLMQYAPANQSSRPAFQILKESAKSAGMKNNTDFPHVIQCRAVFPKLLVPPGITGKIKKPGRPQLSACQSMIIASTCIQMGYNTDFSRILIFAPGFTRAHHFPVGYYQQDGCERQVPAVRNCPHISRTYFANFTSKGIKLFLPESARQSRP